MIARKSIHLVSDLPKNHIITTLDLIMKRPANGISPMEMDKVVGKKLVNEKKEDDQLLWSDLI